MAIANIGVANHAECLYPDTPLFLLAIVCNTNSMKKGVNKDEDGGKEISVANNDEDGGSEPNYNVEERCSDDDNSTASDKVEFN
eukprot:4171481-Ditylum_brightwellii.AAC.1